MRAEHFLWPRQRVLRALRQAPLFVNVQTIEDRLSGMFKGGTPLLFSSGRAALFHSLLIQGLSRGDMVGVFPYASHCVLDAVSKIATPAEIGGLTRLNVVFQQWGFIQHLGLSAGDVEDCVDSLLVPGGKLFPGGSNFEVWSLPKILGTTGGGVLWCRSAATAEAIRKLRRVSAQSSVGTLLWILRLLGTRSSVLHAFWQGAEPQYGLPTRLQTGELSVAIDMWADIVADRQRKLKVAVEVMPDWLKLRSDRLPCVMPVVLADFALGEQFAQKLGISSGLRMIEEVKGETSSVLRKVLPLPIHQDVTSDQFQVMTDCVFDLKRKYRV